MPYKLQPGEPVDQGLRRIVREQIDKTLGEMDDAALDVHETVHQARKRCKKIRAVLRLVRPALGEAYTSANAHFRDAARLLSDTRDATALLETYDFLMDHYAGEVDRRAFAPVRAALTRRRTELVHEEQIDEKLAAFRGQMREAHRRIASWKLDAEGWAAIDGGLRKTYRRGRKTLAEAEDDPADERLHEWRKRVKYHRYHVRLLRGAWHPVLKVHREQLHALSDLLGADHDLAIFQQTMEAEADRFSRIASMPALLGLLGRRRQEMQAAAWTLGARLYAEPPPAFNHRVGAYWDAWERDIAREDTLVLDAP